MVSYTAYISILLFKHTDSNNINYTDFAHQSSGLPTWHRMYLLRFERELQILLNDSDFTLHYWDWTDFNGDRDWTSLLFNDQRLGGYDKYGNVTGFQFTQENWPTVCWFPGQPAPEPEVCDVSRKGRGLVRCPINSLCTADNRAWPTADNVSTVVHDFDMYDTKPYSPLSVNSFRAFLEGTKPGVNCAKDNTGLCNDQTLVLLHNAVSVLYS